MKELLNKISRKKLLINGIYKIINIVNNKIYIGSSSSKYFIYNRLINHLRELRSNTHSNKHLQASFNKHGEDKFYYEILEICIPQDCINKEQYWIDLLKPEFNFCNIAGSTLGIKCSEEKAHKISKANKKFFQSEEGIKLKIKLSEIRRNKVGIKHTDEHKIYISNILKGRKFSKETLEKMKKPRPNLNKSIIDLNTSKKFNSCSEAANYYNVSIGYIRGLCRGEIKSKKFNIIYEKKVGI